jgi:hypothetical protein
MSNNCNPDESAYVIVDSLAHEGFLYEARELISKLSYRGVLSRSFMEQLTQLVWFTICCFFGCNYIVGPCSVILALLCS